MPKLRFYLNKELDKVMAEQFLDEQGGGVDFSLGIFRTHPKLKNLKSLPEVNLRRQNISRYFNLYYKNHHQEIEKKINQAKTAWRQREEEYVKITEDFFGGWKFPAGRYIAYASIIDCNPRFLESKTFQFFYKKSLDDTIHTIAHELLHFIFFDFVEKNFKNEAKRLSEEQLWDLSEIFNIVVLKSSHYRSIIDPRVKITPYPDHQPYLKIFEEIHQNSAGAEEFIRKSINAIKKIRKDKPSPINRTDIALKKKKK